MIYTVVEKDFKKAPFCGKIVSEFGIRRYGRTVERLERITHMPQLQFPIFPEGVTNITPELAFMKKEGRVTYFNGQMPLFIPKTGHCACNYLKALEIVINMGEQQIW